MNDVKTDEKQEKQDKQDDPDEGHQPRERAVLCRNFCGRKTWRWNAICDVCAEK